MIDPLLRLRDEFAVARRYAYFMHAAVCPLPRRAAEAARAFLADLEAHGCLHEPAWDAVREDVRARAARLLNAEPDEIAIVKNTSHGLSLVASGLPWRPGDRVVIPEGEFPSNVYPWLALKDRGVEVVTVKGRGGAFETADLERALPGARLLSVSFVEFFSGFRFDLAALGALCRRHGVLFAVDAIQGLGAFPLDVRAASIDFLAADAHKWLLGPEGVAVFFCRKERLEALRPVLLGWNSVANAGEFFDLDPAYAPSARRFEEGSPNSVGIHAFQESLRLIEEAGVERIAERILRICRRLREGLRARGIEPVSPEGGGRESGIVTFQPPGGEAAARALWKRLEEASILVNLRRGHLRVSPHFYNTEEEIDRLVGAVGR